MFETTGDITMLSKVYIARADLEDTRGHSQDAVHLERAALRLAYTRPNPNGISVSHYNLANYLSRARSNPGEQRAHRLAALLLCHLIGDAHALTRMLHTLARELCGDTERLEAPALPTTLSDVVELIDAGEGVHFGWLVADLCLEPDVADHALAELLSTAGTLPHQPAENSIEHHLMTWDPLITAIADAATNGHTPTRLTDALDALYGIGARTDSTVLITALRQILAGARDRAQLLTGLDDIETAILTTVLDRLPT